MNFMQKCAKKLHRYLIKSVHMHLGHLKRIKKNKNIYKPLLMKQMINQIGVFSCNSYKETLLFQRTVMPRVEDHL